jgi:myo-inositol-1(or 4)-monophosphatase
MPDSLRVLACEAARAAGAGIRQALGAGLAVEQKGAVDLVTEADRASEALIQQFLQDHVPAHGLLGEEGSTRPAKEGKPTWIVDPLDGTTNFAHGIPIFAVSMAAVLDGAVQAGAVYDPMRDELFSAARGQGAWLGDRPLRVSTTDSLEKAVVATGFPYDRQERPDFYLAHWKALMTRTHGVRRCGAAALDLAWVAAGRFDGFWEFGLRAWDVAAGSLLIEEAGGEVSSLDGGPMNLFGARIAASNGHVHQELLEALGSAEPPPGQEPPIPPRPPGF